ncbi:MAG: 50S ribosomal protein L4 [Candidatus Hydrothermales bacterium]
MKAKVFDITGKEIGERELPSYIFNLKPNLHLLWLVTRYYLSRKRAGTANTKTRGEVSGGGRKPWPQKHTGWARHGSIRSPIWRKGGVVFGPKPRDFSISLPYKVKLKALYIALSDRARDERVKVLTGVKDLTLKTKEGEKVINSLGLTDKKVILLFADSERKSFLAFKNIEKVECKRAKDVNAYDVLNSKYIIFSDEGLNEFLEVRGGLKSEKSL